MEGNQVVIELMKIMPKIDIVGKSDKEVSEEYFSRYNQLLDMIENVEKERKEMKEIKRRFNESIEWLEDQIKNNKFDRQALIITGKNTSQIINELMTHILNVLTRMRGDEKDEDK